MIEMKTKNIKLEMIERILNYLDINNKLRIPANERDWPPNLYLFDEPLIPFIARSIYFTEDVLNIDIRSNDDFYNKMKSLSLAFRFAPWPCSSAAIVACVLIFVNQVPPGWRVCHRLDEEQGFFW